MYIIPKQLLFYKIGVCLKIIFMERMLAINVYINLGFFTVPQLH